MKCKYGHDLDGDNGFIVFVKGSGQIRCRICYNAACERNRRKKGILELGTTPEYELFDKHYIKTATCWIWHGALDGTGYGMFRVKSNNRKTIPAHIYSYIRHKGYYDRSKYQLDHLYEVKNCVNPEHLEPVTCSVNMKRFFIRRKEEKRSDSSTEEQFAHNK